MTEFTDKVVKDAGWVKANWSSLVAACLIVAATIVVGVIL